MKTIGKHWLFAAMVAIAFTACNSDDENNVYKVDEGEIQLLMLHPGQQTRVTDTAFENKDSIGVYVTASDAQLQLGGNEVNNEAFVYNGTSWTSVRKVYWNKGNHNVYAYYPYHKKVNDIEDYSFSVSTDQSTKEGYSSSDFLWASKSNVAASNTPITMQFTHRLSNVTVHLEKGENFEGDIPADAEVYIYSTITSCVIDLATGDVAKDNYGSENSIRCRQLNNTQYTAIVVPQNITSRRPLVEVIVGGVSYLMEGKISFKQGYRHTITITLDKNPEQIKIEIGGNVEGWN